MDARACLEWLEGLVAMVSPEVIGWNGSIFCAHLCHHLMGGIGWEHQKASTWHNTHHKDLTWSEME